MKLLIVDDQYVTLQGIARGIDWRAAGFSQVAIAQNAMEARLCFAEDVPDVMLCDIEMPVENGVDFCHWVRQQGYETRIIFLTCHSDFGYAQEAIKLHASDYIVQPAPYEEIREKVCKAAQTVSEFRKKEKLQKLGKGYVMKQHILNGGLWRSYLLNAQSLESILSMPGMPSPNRSGWLVCQQLVQWHESDEGWRKGLLAEALNNFSQEIFGPYAACVLTTFVEYNTYAILIQPKDESYTLEKITGQLRYLSGCYDMYMPCKVAFYVQGSCPLQDMPNVWQKLIHMRDQNVSGQNGVFLADALEKSESQASSYRAQKQNWLKIFQTGTLDDVAANAREGLNALVVERKMNRRVLWDFQRDWLETLREINPRFPEKLEEPEANVLMTRSAQSVEEMQKLIDYTVKLCHSEEEQSITEIIIAYIRDNIYEDIRKEDVAQQVHLNSDYLTRIFKKETGYSVKSFIIHEKMLAARQLLQTTSLSIGSIAMQLGYNNFSHFSAVYKKEFGISPGEEHREG